MPDDNIITFAAQKPMARPKVIYYAPNDAEVSRAVDETQGALMACNQPIFQRNGQLMMPIWEDVTDEDGRVIRVTKFVNLNSDKLRYLLNKKNGIMNLIYRRATIRRLRNGQQIQMEQDIGPPDKLLSTLLAPEHWAFHHVRGFITAPTLRPDGSMINARGFDAATQLYAFWENGLTLPAIPDRPTKDDARAALNVLLELVSEVAFVSELDRMVAIAGLMTPVLHGAYRHSPLFMILAPVAGTGKSYISDMASNIANGMDAPVITGSKEEAEMEKRLVSILLAGDPLISIDNLSFDLNSDLLNQMLSQSIIKPRILGKSKTPNCNWNGTIFATANNRRLAGDLTRRGLISNLDRKEERPAQHYYKHDPIRIIRNDRGRCIAAAMIIARAFMVSGESVHCRPFGTFEGWSRAIREPLLGLSDIDVLDSQEQTFKDDPYRNSARELISLWKMHFSLQEAYKTKDIVDVANEFETVDDQGQIIPDPRQHFGNTTKRLKNQDFHDLLIEQCGEKGAISVKKLGCWLRELRNQPQALINDSGLSDGIYRVVIASHSDKNGHRWKLEAV